MAFALSREIGAPIGVHHGGDAPRGEFLSELRKLDLRELVFHASESKCFALCSPELELRP